jgi:ABC-2 type transport system ATP-binding protein
MTETAADARPALVFSGVWKSFGSLIALRDVTLEVRPGELFALVGGNGAGKTTLIKCLVDFCVPDRGEIRVFGMSHRLTEARAPLVFLPERFSPPHFLTGRDFLAYMAELCRTDYNDQRARDMLRRLDLDTAALAQPVRTYSKGMTQKLGLAACLLSGKSLYLFDEPTSGLDPRARALVKRELRELRAQGHTVFFSSHALTEVSELSDRMAILDGGCVRFAGSPAELVERCSALNLEQAFLQCIAGGLPA